LALMTLEILLTLVELVLLLILEAEPPETFEAAEKGIHCHRFHRFARFSSPSSMAFFRIVSTRVSYLSTECVTSSRSLIVVWAYETAASTHLRTKSSRECNSLIRCASLHVSARVSMSTAPAGSLP
jgi:hypothetical protein